MTNSVLDAYLSSQGKHNNPYQKDFCKALFRIFESHNTTAIGMVQGSTGIGKGAAIVTSAIETSLKKDCPVIVSAPTFKVLNQLIKEHQVTEEALGQTVPYILIYGKNEFVSETALKQWLESTEEFLKNPDAVANKEKEAIDELKEAYEQLNNWIKEGAKDNPEALSPRSWAVSGLMYHVPYLEQAKDFSILADDRLEDQDKGLTSYQQQFSFAQEALVIYCSHAMLARDTWRKMLIKLKEAKKQSISENWLQELKSQLPDGEEFEHFLAEHLHEIESQHQTTMLPNTSYLLIDEAHQLEETFASALTKSVALNSITRQIISLEKSKQKPHTLSNALISTHNKLKEYSHGLNHILMGKYNQNPIENHMRNELQELLKVVNKEFPKLLKGKNTPATAYEIKDNLLYLLNAFTDKAGKKDLCMLAFSPVRRFVSLLVGQQNLKTLFAFLWSNKKVALVSATLYIPSRLEPYDKTFFMNLLRIKENDFIYSHPISPRWVTDPVTLLMPKNDNSPQLLKREAKTLKEQLKNEETFSEDEIDNLVDEQWLNDVARYINDMHKSTVGGTLVLLTAYKDVAYLESILQNSHLNNNNLIFSKKDTNIESLVAKFKSLAAQNLKPIWFAVGQSWTGMDISAREPGKDYHPEDDDYLTDLIIPKIPTGICRSINHKQRCLRNPAYDNDMAIAFILQGMGRLVRSEGLKNNRRIHFLDKRIYSNPLYAGLRHAFNHIQRRYNQCYTAFNENEGWVIEQK